MSDAQHTPPGDASFRASVARQVGGAVALVALVAVIFWAIGSIGGSDTPLVADLPGSSGTDTDDGADDGADDVDDGTDADDGEVDAAEDGAATEGDDGADDAADDAEAEGDTDEDGDADQDDTSERAVDPASVSVQVLDGVKTDGGAAADGVASEIESVGYRIVARNIALDYEVTTVLYNPGSEAAAEQLAADIGGAEVRPQPGNLSEQVDLHVVVGRDRA